MAHATGHALELRMLPVYPPHTANIFKNGKNVENRGNGKASLDKQRSFTKGLRTALGIEHGYQGWVLIYETSKRDPDPQYKGRPMREVTVQPGSEGKLVGAIQVAAIVQYDKHVVDQMKGDKFIWAHYEGNACGVIVERTIRFRNPIDCKRSAARPQGVGSLQGVPKVRDEETVIAVANELGNGVAKRVLSPRMALKYTEIERAQDRRRR